MSKVVFNRHTFNNGVLTVMFNVSSFYNEVISINSVEFQELRNGEYEDLSEGDGDIIERITPSSVSDPSDITYVVIPSNKNDNHLIRAIVYLDVSSDPVGNDLPCCMSRDENGSWIAEEYFLDMSKYEREILSSIRLGCEDNCKVPNTLVNSLLKLFTVQAAVDSHSPQMEMIYNKIACGNNIKRNYITFSRNCNCNG